MSPQQVALDNRGTVYVTDLGQREQPPRNGTIPYIDGTPRVERFDGRGRYLGQIVMPGGALPLGVAADGPRGAVVISCLHDAHTRLNVYESRRLRGHDLREIGSIEGAAVFTADSRGFWVVGLWDMRRERLMSGPPPSGSDLEPEIIRLDSHGHVLRHVELPDDGQVIALAAGSDGHLYVAERVRDTYELGARAEHHGRNRVLVHDQRPRLLASFDTGGPTGIATDANGDVYLATGQCISVMSPRWR